MTELAYLSDGAAGYVRSFRARVTALPPGGIVLDRTFFYPAGGGQMADQGTLQPAAGPPWKVTDVTKSGAAVIHRIGRPAGSGTLTVGDEVEGAIDWGRRHRHMRLHTAQHLLSARIFSLTGLRTRKATMSGVRAEIELESTWPAGLVLEELDADVRRFLSPGRPVQIRYVPREEFERFPSARAGLVPLAPQVDPVRIVEIESADACPCGGTHVRDTGEIGPIALGSPSTVPGGASRISFTVGADAPPTPGA
ncbi:MAG: alanyl-tRNA editing protein [Thermoplasmata archaeon]|nr:alanyl-tRNA editing protein [Thermoplasmata archaeon]